jgi:hypothetical protein
MGLKWLSWLLVVLLLATGWAEVERGTSSTYSTAPGVRGGPVYIDTTEILLLESFPVQVRLVVRGALPTPCHEAVWEVEDRGDAIHVSLWSEADPKIACAQVLEPFEASIPLGSFESSVSPVFLNGEDIGRLAIGPDPAGGSTSLVRAGWSFGMCGGYCTADLAIRASELVLTGGSHMAAEPLYRNHGALTPLGRKRIDAALESLSAVALEPVYGCPDCADGGAAYLTLMQDGTISRHEMVFGDPPNVLAELHGLAMEMIASLETCDPDELVAIGDGCEAWQGR